MENAKRSVKNLLRSVGLLDLLIELKVRIRDFTVVGFVRNLRYRLKGAPDRLPIPPPHLIYLAIGSTDVSAFLESGSVHARSLILDTLQKNGLAMEQFDDVLDFGCGCGRIMRYWASLQKVRLYGMDYNPQLIKWCERNLSFARYQTNELHPPLRCDPEKFDFIYARSIFTHLPATLQRAWLRELWRVLKPHGLLLFTVSGLVYHSWLTDSEKQKFDAGQLIVRDQDQAGKNLCAVFHPEKWMRRQLTQNGFALTDIVPGKAIKYFYQDVYLVQKRDTLPPPTEISL